MSSNPKTTQTADSARSHALGPHRVALEIAFVVLFALGLIGAVNTFTTDQPGEVESSTPVMGCEPIGTSRTPDGVFDRELPAGVEDGTEGCRKYYDLDWEGPHTFGRPPSCG